MPKNKLTKGRLKSDTSTEVLVSPPASRFITNNVFTGIPVSARLKEQEAIPYSNDGYISGSIIIPVNLAGKRIIIDGVAVTVEDALTITDNQGPKTQESSKGHVVKSTFIGSSFDSELNPVYSTSELAARVVVENEK